MASSSAERRFYQVVPASEARDDASGLPQLVLYKPDGTLFPATSFTVMPVQAASVAADLTAMKVDFNALLTKLKNAGYMASS